MTRHAVTEMKMFIDTAFGFKGLVADDTSKALYLEWYHDPEVLARRDALANDFSDDPKQDKLAKGEAARLTQIYQSRSKEHNFWWEVEFYNEINDTEIVDLEVDWVRRELTFDWIKTVSKFIYESREIEKRQETLASIVLWVCTILSNTGFPRWQRPAVACSKGKYLPRAKLRYFLLVSRLSLGDGLYVGRQGRQRS